MRRLHSILSQVALFHAASGLSSTKAQQCGAAGNECKPTLNQGYEPFELINTTVLSPDSRLLRFALPPSMLLLGASLPSCLKVKKTYPVPDGQPAVVLDKSYSPVSLPKQEGWFELVVKGYPARSLNTDPGQVHTGSAPPPGEGGLGAFLVGLKVGDTANMTVKADRMIHGLPYQRNRWRELGLVAGGTGIAPMLQMIMAVLDDPEERTRLWLLFANRHEEDILMRHAIDALVTQHPDRLRVRYVLSAPKEPAAWTGGIGRLDMEDVSTPNLPPPGEGTMVMVCGRDDFVRNVCGMTQRGPAAPGQKKGPKIQGALTGLLKEAGYQAEQVYKF